MYIVVLSISFINVYCILINYFFFRYSKGLALSVMRILASIRFYSLQSSSIFEYLLQPAISTICVLPTSSSVDLILSCPIDFSFYFLTNKKINIDKFQENKFKKNKIIRPGGTNFIPEQKLLHIQRLQQLEMMRLYCYVSLERCFVESS